MTEVTKMTEMIKLTKMTKWWNSSKNRKSYCQPRTTYWLLGPRSDMLAVEKVDEVPFIPLIILFSPLLSLYNKLTPLRLEELLQNKKRPLTLISHFPSQNINFTMPIYKCRHCYSRKFQSYWIRWVVWLLVTLEIFFRYFKIWIFSATLTHFLILGEFIYFSVFSKNSIFKNAKKIKIKHIWKNS